MVEAIQPRPSYTGKRPVCPRFPEMYQVISSKDLLVVGGHW
jgi:hypothetical protein